MKRREFITLLGGAAAAWPLAARAQQGERIRRIGVLMNLTSDDPEAIARLAAFHQGLQQHNWTIGQNLRVDHRWGAGDPERYRRFAEELVALAPDAFFAATTPTVRALQRVTRTLPIVFGGAIDPVGSGLVASLAQPGGNVTGFSLFEYSISGKWLEILKQAVPTLRRAAVIRDTTTVTGVAQFAAIQAVAPSLGVELRPLEVSDTAEIEPALAAFARPGNSGLIVTASPLSLVHRELIITLAMRHKLTAVYPFRAFVTGGGLICYGPDLIDGYRRAAGYVDRILKGAKPADLPVQAPTKYELVINLKTAKALGLDVPPTLLARADEVIE
jgi:putative ABC transport system substrate-binding protein